MFTTIAFHIPKQHHHNEVGVLCAQNFTKFVIKLRFSLSWFLGRNVIGLIVKAPGIAPDTLGTQYILYKLIGIFSCA